MPSSSPSKPQLAICAAFAVAVLLIGARFLRHGAAASPPDASAPPATFAAGTATDAGAAGASASGASAGDVAGAQVVVDVEGAVRRPGVYRLPTGARADDAIRRAGGLTARADRIGVNLAARVVDGGEVVVPERGAGASRAAAGGGMGGGPPGAGGAAGAGSSAGPLSLDLDTATEQQLEQLDGVGPALAAKIVAYREQHGGISSVEDLDNVSGIGPAKLAAIRAQLGR